MIILRVETMHVSVCLITNVCVGYQKMGYSKQRSKKSLDPKNRTNEINKRGLGRNLRFARDPVAEPQPKRTILRLARDRLAEAPSPGASEEVPILRFTRGRLGTSPVTASSIKLL